MLRILLVVNGTPFASRPDRYESRKAGFVLITKWLVPPIDDEFFCQPFVGINSETLVTLARDV
jgi:hypothetical protein